MYAVCATLGGCVSAPLGAVSCRRRGRKSMGEIDWAKIASGGSAGALVLLAWAWLRSLLRRGEIVIATKEAAELRAENTRLRAENVRLRERADCAEYWQKRCAELQGAPTKQGKP